MSLLLTDGQTDEGKTVSTDKGFQCLLVSKHSEQTK